MNKAEADYYRILDVLPEASAGEIKDAYRRLALEHHPDRNRDAPDAAEKMKAINEAYAVLSNPDKRREYDALRRQYGGNAFHQFRQTHSEADIFKDSDIQAVFEEIARSFGLRGFDAIFKDLHRPGYRRFQIRRPGFTGGGFVFWGAGAPGKMPLPLLSGKTMNRLARAAVKLLTGVEPKGIGADVTETVVLSAEEALRGGPFPFYHRRQDKKLVVKLPAGLRGGQKIRLAGMGRPGTGGGPPGDLFLKVRIKKSLGLRIKELLS